MRAADLSQANAFVEQGTRLIASIARFLETGFRVATQCHALLRPAPRIRVLKKVGILHFQRRTAFPGRHWNPVEV
jgi:hypothetical protein